MHQTMQIIPYDLANCADLGDCPVNPANVDDGLKRVETYFKTLVGKGHQAAVGGRRSSLLAARSCARSARSGRSA